MLNDFYEFKFEPVSIPPSHLVEDLRSIVNNSVLGDVTFLVEDMPVYATRSHLAARSDHFRALFYGGRCFFEDDFVFQVWNKAML